MRKLMLLVAGSLMLVTAGIALARGLDQAKSVRLVAGTFTATAVSHSQTRSCTTADGKTIASTNATYTGIASGDPALAGAITIQVRSTIDATEGLGVLDGKLKIAAAGGDTVAHLTAVYDHGAIAGLASGQAKTSPHAKLLGNLSAGFSATGGFTSGKIGGGTSGGSALVLEPGKCAPAKPPKPPHETSEAHGTVAMLTATSITIGGLTCTIPATLAAKVSMFKVGDRAEIKCSLENGINTLVKISPKK